MLINQWTANVGEGYLKYKAYCVHTTKYEITSVYTIRILMVLEVQRLGTANESNLTKNY